MQLYSTNHQSPNVSVEEAILRGLPADNGLFMPTHIPVLPTEFWDTIEDLTLRQIAFRLSHALLEEAIPPQALEEIIEKAIDFDAPLVKVGSAFCLELFHGPSMAFKDFGARFMAGVMSYFLRQSNQQVHILVATSGDTGGAVAQGFYGVPNISVTILYPQGKVSDIQEKQLTTLGQNVRAIEVQGTFDDCQRLVKEAFLNDELRAKYQLASANSINIARLIPQAFYYAYAYAQLKKQSKEVVFSVPSGNFGNLSAGILAWRMGMPVRHFVAATNENNVVPHYLQTAEFEPISPSISTISNAMDVGNPSNFPRLKALFGDDYEAMTHLVKGYYYTDEQARQTMKAVFDAEGYAMCPHTAIAYRGLADYQKEYGTEAVGVFLSTAHYAKFLPEVEPVLGTTLPIPSRLSDLLIKEKKATLLRPDFEEFKQYLIANL